MNIPFFSTESLVMQLFQDLATAELIQLNEETIAEAYTALYQTWEAALTYSGADVVWGLSSIPVPFINNVTRVRFSADNFAQNLENIRAKAQHRKVPIRFWLGPNTQPEVVKPWLIEQNFRHVELAGMVINLVELETPRFDAAVHTVRIEDEAGIQTWSRVLSEGFDVPLEATQGFGQAVLSGGLNQTGWRLYLAYVNDEPVAAATQYLGTQAAGIYNVATLPQARGKGAGSAVSYAALHEAREAGYHISTLQASQLGQPVYARLGFQEVCKFDLYIQRDSA